jgi:large subunit ribosomal protein L22
MATQTTTPRVEARASVRNLGVSPNKVRPVLDLMRKLSANDAERLLQLQPRTAAGHVLKLLESAIANAEHNQQIPIDELFVDRCWCDEGPTRKWGQARARGRYFRIRKRSSHITIVLARYSEDELRKILGRDDSQGAGSAGARVARRRSERVRASRAAARGETVDHDHADHDHEHDDAGVDETVDETADGAAATDVPSSEHDDEADADATVDTADETSAEPESEIQ